MYCPKCGTKNDDQARHCMHCGVSLTGSPAEARVSQTAEGSQKVPNYLVWAILITVCCCQPFGVLAIIFSVQVDRKLALGDYEGAVEASKKVKMWCWLGFGLGILVYIIVIILNVIPALLK